MPKKTIIFFLLVSLLMCNGCWSRTEVEDLAIVSAIGIDRVEIEGRPKWKITFQIFQPQSTGGESQKSGGQGATVWVASSYGETLDDARMNFNTRTPRVIFAAHTSSMIIGEDTARSGNLTEITDYLLRHTEFRLRNWFFVTEGTASQLLTAKPELEQNIATQLEGMVKNTSKRVSKGAIMDLKEVVTTLASPGRDVIIGRIEVSKIPEQEASTQNAPDGEGQQLDSIKLHGAAVFSKERMVDWFKAPETRGYLYIMGDAEQTAIPFALEQGTKADVSLSMVNSESKITPQLTEQQLSFQVEIEAEGDIVEMQKLHPITPELLEKIERKAEQVIKREAEEAVARAQELRADVFGLGETVYRKYPAYWKEIQSNWRDYYINLPIEISVKVEIRRTGMITDHLPVQ